MYFKNKNINPSLVLSPAVPRGWGQFIVFNGVRNLHQNESALKTVNVTDGK